MALPTTPAEWQEAVDGAAACRSIADCMMYGLLTGGPKINVARCDQILEAGRRRGIYPSRPVVDLAAEFITAFNAEREEARTA